MSDKIIVKDFYHIKRYNRKRNYYHFMIGIKKMFQLPILFVFLLPIIALTVFMWMKMDYLIKILDMPKLLLPFIKTSFKFFGVIIPFLLVGSLIETTGKLTARKDEADVEMAFTEHELRYGRPILKHKSKDKKSGVTKREFYSTISKKLWEERKEVIEDSMNITILTISYGGRKRNKGKLIYLESYQGRSPKDRGVMYDKEF